MAVEAGEEEHVEEVLEVEAAVG
jgi:predicted DNA-binding protein with PD1-like motif